MVIVALAGGGGDRAVVTEANKHKKYVFRFHYETKLGQVVLFLLYLYYNSGMEVFRF